MLCPSLYLQILHQCLFQLLWKQAVYLEMTFGTRQKHTHWIEYRYDYIQVIFATILVYNQLYTNDKSSSLKHGTIQKKTPHNSSESTDFLFQPLIFVVSSTQLRTFCIKTQKSDSKSFAIQANLSTAQDGAEFQARAFTQCLIRIYFFTGCSCNISVELS